MKKCIVFYDNWCPNCTRFSKIIQKLDWFHLVQFKELRNKKHLDSVKELDEKLAFKQMASFTKKWSYGYKSLYHIFLRLPLFWLVIPLFWLLQITSLGQYFYMFLAVNRQIIPLHCTKETCEI